MELLKQIFTHPEVSEFVSRATGITNRYPAFIKNALGVNFSQDGLQSVKIYYNWVHPLHDSELDALLDDANRQEYRDQIARMQPRHFQPSMDFAYGQTFAIKIDRNHTISRGYFLMPDIEENDPFYAHPRVQEYFEHNNSVPCMPRKGEFTMIGDKGKTHKKHYYYVTDPALKKSISEGYDFSPGLAPVLEWIFGKGFYSGSSDADEKINLLLNYDQVFRTYGLDRSWAALTGFTKALYSGCNLRGFCPGFYKNGNVRSLYYFHVDPRQPSQLDTIPEVMKYLKLL